MAETWIELQVIEGLALPYEAGAEQALDGELFDGWLFDEWQALIAAYPGLTLQPLFSTEP